MPPTAGADFAVYRQTRAAHEDHEAAKANLKKLMPEDAREALGHGLRAKRPKLCGKRRHLPCYGLTNPFKFKSFLVIFGFQVPFR